MASIKISELESVTSLTESDALPIVNGNETKKVTIEKLGDILATKDYVAESIAELGSLGFTPIIVETLPTENISTNTIYLKLNATQGDENIYDEYVHINNTWELIGSTAIDLGNYYTKTETDTELNKKQDKLTAGDNITIVDNVISATGGSSSAEPLLYSDMPVAVLSSVNPSGESDFAIISEIFTNYYKKFGTLNKISFAISSGTTNAILWHNKNLISTGGTLTFNRFMFNPTYLKYCGWHSVTFTPTYNNDGTVTVSAQGSVTVGETFDTALLMRNNTTAFTPTGDYNPATKKYVDDAISTAITTVLEAEY